MATTANRRAARELRAAIVTKFVRINPTQPAPADQRVIADLVEQLASAKIQIPLAVQHVIAILVEQLASAKIQIRLLMAETKQQRWTISVLTDKVAALKARVRAQAHRIAHLEDRDDALRSELRHVRAERDELANLVAAYEEQRLADSAELWEQFYATDAVDGPDVPSGDARLMTGAA